MNRLVLIGNGFDLAHGLKTSYADFINWYYDKRIKEMCCTYKNVSSDELCSFKYLGEGYLFTYFYDNNTLKQDSGYGKELFEELINNSAKFETNISPLFNRIRKGVKSKTWGGIEQDYYDLLKEYAFRNPSINPAQPPIKALNQQLRFLQQLLMEYLKEVTQEDPTKIKSIEDAIYAPLDENDIAVESLRRFEKHKWEWEDHPERDKELREIAKKYGLDEIQCDGDVRCWREDQPNGTTIYPPEFLLPNNIMLLNFNYTNTAERYNRTSNSFKEIHIHGKLDNPTSIIFGYGDELDDKFKELKAHRNNACLSHVKSIKYLEASNYRQMLSFIESASFQVLIMGHSCGNSDRTLLNTIFEHPNCVSIKPYYYITDKEKGSDNYIELVQHISRNFNDMKLMRDRVVNKTQCEPLVK